MTKAAVKKGSWIAKFLSRMADEVHSALFRYQVKSGLILCAVDPDEGDGGSAAGNDGTDQVGSNGQQEGDTPPGDTTSTDDSSVEDGDVIVTIGEDSPPSDEDENRAPEWVRELRKANREKDKRIRELEQQVKATQPAPKGTVVGEKPTLTGCDYDEEKFERELLAWEGRKRQVEEEQRKKEAEAKAQQDAWNARLETHGKQAADLKVKDYGDAEEAVRAVLNEVQQAIIVSGSENSALMMYALGKNPAKAKELASITDPVKFAFAVAKLEPQLKVTQRQKSAPLPEKTLRGSAPLSGSVDSELERLRDEAAKTGDMSKVMAYRRQKQRAA